MKRLAFVGLLFTLLLGVFAAPAHAAVSQVSFTYGDCAIDCESGDITVIHGTITCTSGEAYTVRVNLRQNGQTAAVGRAHGTCTGSLQNWDTTRVDNPGTLQCELTTASGRAVTASGAKTFRTTYTDSC
jgi:hypothetical protein